MIGNDGLGILPAAPAADADAQSFAQLIDVPGATLRGSADFPVGDSLAQANIHQAADCKQQ